MSLGTNYTLYYNVLNYLKTIMKNHPSINYVTQGDVFSIDTREFPQYPMGNVLVTAASLGEKTTDYTIQLVVADKVKLKGNESSGSHNVQTIDFEGTDDVVDIHANTMAILNDLISWTQHKEEGFEIIGDTSLTAFKERFDNGLAGWTADFTLRVHNDKNRCLFFLTSPSGSGYLIEDCATSQSYYAVINSDLEVGDVFQSSYPTDSSCFSVKGEVTDWENWNLINLPTDVFYDTCEECLSAQPFFVSRSLIHWYDANTGASGNTWSDLQADKDGTMDASTLVTTPSYNYWNIDTSESGSQPTFGESPYNGSDSRTVLFWTRLHFPNEGPFTDSNLISYIGDRGFTGGKVTMTYESGSGMRLGFTGANHLYESASVADETWTMVGYRFEGDNASDFEVIVNNQIYSGSTADLGINTIDGVGSYDDIGNETPNTDLVFSGSMAVKLEYSSKLTQTEINQLYNFYRGRFN